MSDTYQPIYDAVRSKLSGCDVGDAVARAAREAFDLPSNLIQNAIAEIASAYAAPHAVMKPTISLDGDKWCALYGENLQVGVAGFGDSPYLAMQSFDLAWYEKLSA